MKSYPQGIYELSTWLVRKLFHYSTHHFKMPTTLVGAFIIILATMKDRLVKLDDFFACVAFHFLGIKADLAKEETEV